jgi:predicted dehydrogenase
MHFAVSGDHPEVLALAAALAGTQRYRLLCCYSSPATADWLSNRGIPVRLVPDRDAFFAEPEPELILVGDALPERPAVLRRAVRSERHVICAAPADLSPDVAYEAAWYQQETRKVLLPLLYWRLDPGLQRLRQVCTSDRFVPVTLLEGDFSIPPGLDPPADAGPGTGKRLRNGKIVLGWDRHPGLWCWDLIRYLAGEVSEVSVVGAAGESWEPSETVTLTGRCRSGVLFRLWLAGGGNAEVRLVVRGSNAEAVLRLPGPGHPADQPRDSRLDVRIGSETEAQTWSWHPWPALVAAFETALSGGQAPVSWQDQTRCLELFESAGQSAKRRRVISVAYEEATEAANFKSLMTALGCLTLVAIPCLLVVFLILGLPLVPWTVAVLLPLLLLFLLLQVLGWVIPRPPNKPA